MNVYYTPNKHNIEVLTRMYQKVIEDPYFKSLLVFQSQFKQHRLPILSQSILRYIKIRYLYHMIIFNKKLLGIV